MSMNSGRVELNDTELKLRVLIKNVFSLEEIPADFLLLQLGSLARWDSLGNFNLLLAVEEEFGLRFSMDQMGEIRSVKDIIEVVDGC